MSCRLSTGRLGRCQWGGGGGEMVCDPPSWQVQSLQIPAPFRISRMGALGSSVCIPDSSSVMTGLLLPGSYASGGGNVRRSSAASNVLACNGPLSACHREIVKTVHVSRLGCGA